MPITLRNGRLNLGVAGIGFRYAQGHPFLTATITNFAAQPVTYNVSLPAGKVMVIEWGDGTSSTVTGPVTNTDYARTYAGNGTYQTRLRGDYRSLTRFLAAAQVWVGGTTVQFMPLVNLSFLYLNSVVVAGTTSNLSSISSLTYLNINNTLITYSAAASPKWRGTIYCQSLAWPQAHVDAFLAECVTAGYSGAYALNISGTNAAPSAAGLANRDILVARGWTVTVTA